VGLEKRKRFRPSKELLFAFGNTKVSITRLRVSFRIFALQSINMKTATPFPRPTPSRTANEVSAFHSIFECSPLAAACCSSQGSIVAMNPVFKRSLTPELTRQECWRLTDFFPLSSQSSAESAIRDLFACNLDSVQIAHESPALNLANWRAWRLPAKGEESPHALLIADPSPRAAATLAGEESLLQAQRWEAVGRLAGGVVHDFNNVLTGVMLYTDLLLSSIDARDRRRRYAEEIRSAIVQASGLVRQLLVFARPQKIQVRALCLNQVAEDMKDLLTRLIGDNIALEFKLDPDLGLLKIDQARAQQIILNLVLNARDAMPHGGRVVVETSNCRFQRVAGFSPAVQAPAFPCILFAVSDNGCGMDEQTHQRLFEPFFTTKGEGKGTGLGLATVRSIVTTNSGLIHVESQPGRGTRVMILLPRASQAANAVFLAPQNLCAQPSEPTFQGIQKDSLQ
jgi:signal transduction histidine kinase